jgi:hypothetical protein
MITYENGGIGLAPGATVTDRDQPENYLQVTVVHDHERPAVLFRPSNSALTAVSPQDAQELAGWLIEQLS